MLTRRVVYLMLTIPAIPGILIDAPRLVADDRAEAESLFQRARGAIDGNLAAARSVEIRGRHQIHGTVIKASDRPEVAPYEQSATFGFISDEFGRLRRWELTYDQEYTAPPRDDERCVLVGDYGLAVSRPTSGYVRTSTEVLDTIGIDDFYKYHWPGDSFETLDVVLHRQNPREIWRVSTLPDGNSRIVFEIREPRGQKGKTISRTYEIDSSLSYLPTGFEEFGGMSRRRLRWKRDHASDVWYIEEAVYTSGIIYPSGLVFETISTHTVEEAHFNRPSDPETFTFKGLGLLPGAHVYDQRPEPDVEYTFEPTAPYDPATIAGLVPLAAAPASAERIENGASGVENVRPPARRRWVAVAVMVAVAVLAGGLAYVRRRRK